MVIECSSNSLVRISLLLTVLFFALPVSAQIFLYQATELQLQYGRYEIPFTGSSDSETGFVYTFQHAHSWKYGDTYMFIDYSDLDESGTELYGEIYPNFSLGKITGRRVGFWKVKDVGVLLGYNYGRDTRIRKYLPGVRLSWDFPGFTFLNTDFTLYLDGNKGLNNGSGIPKEDDSYMIDVNWAAPFDVGRHSFSIEGHVEYIGSRDNEFGEKIPYHILAQPQFRYDLGKTWFDKKDELFVGIEWQYWKNKNGDRDTNESAPQLLIVCRL